MNWYIFSNDADSGCSWWATSDPRPSAWKITYILYLHELLYIEQYFDGMKVWLNGVEERFLPPLTGREPMHNTGPKGKLK